MPRPAAQRSELPKALWLWFPLALLGTQYFFSIWHKPTYLGLISSELGLIENLTVVFLFIAIITGINLVRHRDRLPFPWMTKWIILICLGSFYFMGEEASWGQHWFGWTAPEHIAATNKQDETNFHNHALAYPILDLLPRNLLSLAVGIGGLIVPLLRRGHRRWPSSNYRHWLWPTIVCVPAAAIASCIRLPNRIAGSDLPDALEINAGETEEWALAFVIMLYLLSLRSRLKPA